MIGKINKEVLPTMGMKNPLRYRNKVSTHKDSQGKIGLMKFNSHEIICFEECSQILKANESAFQAINELGVPQQVTQVQIRSTTEGETGICVSGNNNNKELHNFAQKVNAKDQKSL